MFVLQLLVAVMSLMGLQCRQPHLTNCLVSFQPRDMSPLRAPTGEALRVLRERLVSRCLTLGSFSPVPESPVAAPALPPTRARP